MAKPPSDIKLADKPNWFIIMKVTKGVITMVATTTKLERTSPKNNNKMMMMNTMPSSSTLVTIHSAESTNSVRS